MAKRKYKQKASALPKGLPTPKNKNKKARTGTNTSTNTNTNTNNRVSKATTANAAINPFESARASSAKAPKFAVHNRNTNTQQSINNNNELKGAGSALKRALDNRKRGLKESMLQSKKAGAFIDRRIGESRKAEMTEEERMLARIVRERSQRSKKLNKYSLDDAGDDGGVGSELTHKGKLIDDSYTGKIEASDVILSDDEDKYGGQLERADTELHFGGGAFERERVKQASGNQYGPSGGVQGESLGDRYRSRREELEDLIMRKKFEKAEKAKQKETQVETFESLDDNFKELAAMLTFRDKEQDRKEQRQAKRTGTLSQEDKEMDDWDKEMKAYLFDRKVKATDRTKTAEESAKDEAKRLHELETRRLARMSGDFDNDDFSDISDDEGDKKKYKGKKSKKVKGARNPDELDSDDEDNEGELKAKFTADGLVYVDKMGNVVKKHGEDDVSDKESGDDDGDDDDDETPAESSEEEDSDAIGGSDDDASVDSGDGLSEGEESDVEGTVLEVGANIKGQYLAAQQFEGKGKWYKGTVKKVSHDERGNTLYEVEYEDGDIETDVKPKNVRRQKKSSKEVETEEVKKAKLAKISMKRQKAKQKARYVMGM